MKKNTNAAKIRRFSFVSYCPLDFVLSVLSAHINSIKCYAVAVHDNEKEKSDNHIHILIHTYSSWEYRALLRWFKHVQNTFVEPILNDCSALDYLTHKNDDSKVQYDESIIINHNFDLDLFEIQNNGFLPLQFMLDGVSLVDIAKRFGKDFIYHYTSYKSLYDDIKFYSSNNSQNKACLEPIQEELPF